MILVVNGARVNNYFLTLHLLLLHNSYLEAKTQKKKTQHSTIDHKKRNKPIFT